MFLKIDNSYYEEIAQNFSLLFICDDINDYEVSFFSIFKDTYICTTEEEAHKLFNKIDIDIVFIDTDTKNINWLSVVKSLRKKVYDLPIAILTDAKNTENLTTAINSNITQCILKPIDKKRLKLSIFDITNKLQNKLDAKELFHRKEKEKLSNMISINTQNLIENIPYPIFVFHGEKVFFANKNLYQLFKDKKINLKQLPTLTQIGNLFENYTDEICFSNIALGKSLDVKYNYKDYSLKKIFIPAKFQISLDGVYEHCSVVVLNNIAPLLMQINTMSYQKNKLETYKEVIEELLIKQIFKYNNKAIVSKVEDKIEIRETIDDKLNSEDKRLLRKSTQNKISAVDYLSDLDDSAFEEINELIAIEEDIQMGIDSFVDYPTTQHAIIISKLFKTQGIIINSLMEFIDLGNAVCSLSDFISELDEEQIKFNSKNMGIQFENILADLTQWRENIFEKQDSIDIHYLDSSIFSSILQFQIGISTEEDLSNDLELF